jgi:hypothetical protein
MKLLIVCVGIGVLIGCHPKQPRMSDAQMQKIRAAEPGMTDECLDKIRWGGIEALTGRPEDCFKFDPPRRWKGLWYAAFEESRFCPEPARQCSSAKPGEWISPEAGPGVVVPHYNGESSAVMFAVDFIGRKTSYPGGYGHQGQSNQEIIIDRMIAMKRIEPPKE